MNTHQIKQKRILGISFGTACSRLRKNVLFSLVCKTNNDNCYVCKKKIKTVAELSIEHKIPWESTKNASLFWDLENIAFSHLSCNIPHSTPRQKMIKKNSLWCTICKQFRKKIEFVRDSSRWSNRSNKCRKCFNILRRIRRKNGKKD